MTKRIEKTIEMTKAQWDKWEKHLYSGKIKQCESILIDREGAMCCLGVLQFALEGKVERNSGYPSSSFMERNNIVFRDEWGNDLTSDGSGQISPYCTGGYANQLNDELKLSFKQIARRLKSRVKFIKPKKISS